MPAAPDSPVRRATRAARAVRDRVAGEVHVGARVADLEAQVGRLTAEVTELRATVRSLQQNGSSPATAVRKGPVTQRQSARVEQVVAAVDAEHLSYLGPNNLRTLAWAVTQLDANGVPGAILEAGTALGGSAIVMAAAKSAGRPLRAHDVFGMIPPPGGENGIELVPGLFEDTIAVDSPVALAHLDGDWYDSTMVCLTRIVPHLSRGGRLVIDDYDSWSGCRTAIDEFFLNRPGFAYERRGRLHIVKR